MIHTSGNVTKPVTLYTKIIKEKVYLCVTTFIN